jgi:S-(hydroxymethyl)glutathione dehydrogenase / alcohol dehydrogenase
MNKTEIFNFTAYDDIGEVLKETTKGGADVVIDCVGMDGNLWSKSLSFKVGH